MRAEAGGRPSRYVGVIGHSKRIEHESGVGNAVRALGAEVRTMALGGGPQALIEDGDFDNGVECLALIFEPGDRPDDALRALGAIRREPMFQATGALVILPRSQATGWVPAGGFDDFVVAPARTEEIYARIRGVQWKRRERVSGLRLELGPIVLHTDRREVTVLGKPIQLTTKEFSLLSHFIQYPGSVLTRRHLLRWIWGQYRASGSRTVDIHVRRLRMKLGEAFQVETVRGRGYRLKVPS